MGPIENHIKECYENFLDVFRKFDQLDLTNPQNLEYFPYEDMGSDLEEIRGIVKQYNELDGIPSLVNNLDACADHMLKLSFHQEKALHKQEDYECERGKLQMKLDRVKLDSEILDDLFEQYEELKTCIEVRDSYIADYDMVAIETRSWFNDTNRIFVAVVKSNFTTGLEQPLADYQKEYLVENLTYL